MESYILLWSVLLADNVPVLLKHVCVERCQCVRGHWHVGENMHMRVETGRYVMSCRSEFSRLHVLLSPAGCCALQPGPVPPHSLAFLFTTGPGILSGPFILSLWLSWGEV